jgi:TniQ
MPVLPKPYPDEVVGSVIVRACRHTGLPLKRLLFSIFRGQRATFSFLLGESFARLAYPAGLDPEELLAEHTMFRYATAFMPTAVQAQLTAKALAARPGEVSLASLTKNISHGVSFRRVCKLCIQAELSRYGETYWHREHLLPGVLICPQHGRPLEETGIELRGGAHSSVVLLPHEVLQTRPTETLPSQLASRVAAISAAALRGTLPRSDDRLCDYRAKAAALGYMLPSGDIAGGVVGHMVRRTFGDEYLAATGCPVAEDSKSAWPALMVRPGGTPNFASPKHVLMQALFDAEVRPPKNMSSMYGPPGKQTRDYGHLDASTLARLRMSVRVAARNGNRTTVEALLREAGVWSAFKHRRELFPRTDAFLQEFRHSDQSERQLGGRPYWRKRLPSRYGKVEGGAQGAGDLTQSELPTVALVLAARTVPLHTRTATSCERFVPIHPQSTGDEDGMGTQDCGQQGQPPR